MIRKYLVRLILGPVLLALAACGGGGDSGEGSNNGDGGGGNNTNTPPTITILGDNPFTLIVGNNYSDPGATSNDAQDGDLTSNISVDTSNLNTNTVGSYIVTYSVTDSDGATTEVDRSVNVVTDPGSLPKAFRTDADTSRFLSQATFGATQDAIDTYSGTDVSDWIQEELAKDPTLHLEKLLAQYPSGPPDGGNNADNFLYFNASSNSQWETMITADDQLRQRMAYALSQILVVSNNQTSTLASHPLAMGYYMDVLTRNALGNYRQLLEDVTYSPAMAIYLTYLNNRRADPETGRMPDENYAREIMQLFTIGLVELNTDGTPVLIGGEAIETYNNNDITEIAKVFTGIGAPFSDDQTENVLRLTKPLEIIETFHSPDSKSFLGAFIPAGTEASDSIDIALDTLFNHQNLPPFISRQLIQRFTKSHPGPAYVERVANVFSSGSYTLPNGEQIGTGTRGDLAATIAAILLDDEAREDNETADNAAGKVREPVLRFTQWARAFNINSADPSDEEMLYDTMQASRLAQHPYRSHSVFNFYRPGYVAPGTATGEEGLTMPELQILNAGTAAGYVNFMSSYIRDDATKWSRTYGENYHPDYSFERSLSGSPDDLVDHLDLLLSGNRLQADTKERIVSLLNEIPISSDNNDPNIDARVHNAILMVMTAPGYLTQR